MIGIHPVGTSPTKLFNRRIGLGADAGGVRADNRVFAIGLIPNRCDCRAHRLGLHKRGQLRFAFATKPVANPDAVAFELCQTVRLR